MSDVWASGQAYDAYVGQWSRLVAREFLPWLGRPNGLRWVDVGCGTGALSEAILGAAAPRHVLAVDRAPAYVAVAHRQLPVGVASCAVADAQSLPARTGSVDVVVSALVLNFVPRPDVAVGEMSRILASGGLAAVYVWDYAGGMQLLRYFWDAAAELDSGAAELDEGRRFPMCRPDALEALFRDAGFFAVESRAIDVPTRFGNFDEYWTPFLGGQGPAPGYVARLGEQRRAALRDRLRAALPVAGDGSISLVSRAWAVRGIRAR